MLRWFLVAVESKSMKARFPLFSEVVLLEDLPTHRLKRGAIATVVEHYSTPDSNEDGYSLEGLDVPGITLEVSASQITSLEQWQKEMQILEKLHQLSIAKLTHLEAYIEKLLAEEINDQVKAS